MFPLCLHFFCVRLHTSTDVIGTGEKEKGTGNLPVSRHPSPHVTTRCHANNLRTATRAAAPNASARPRSHAASTASVLHGALS